ncbi:MAG: hypothetical protein MMC33_004850 [Icmadophila ericetorum]|nr:hypothetical protein [Icmadophila ericetorum]
MESERYKSSSYGSVDGFPEIDTPKPLHVVKRSNSQISHQDTLNTLCDISNTITSEYRHTVPKRTSSVSKFNSEPSENFRANRHLHGAAVRPTPRPSGAATLIVQKRRRGNTRESAPANEIFETCSRPPAYESKLASHSPTRHIGQQLHLKNPPVEDFNRARAQTETLREQLAIDPVSHTETASKELKAYSHRRIKSTNLLTTADLSQTKRLNGTATIVETARKLQRRGTDKASLYRHQLLHRLGGGFPEMAESNTAMDVLEVQQKPQSTIEPPSQNSREVINLTRSSSTNTSSSNRSDLADTIAAFPSPPISCTTSFTRTSSGNCGSQIRTQVFMSPPEVSPIASVQLKMTPEMETLEDDGRRSLFVAVDIEGIIPALESNVTSMSRSRLDIAIVIDNSVSTSPTALMASCEITTFIASILDSELDRMTVITTHATEGESRSFNIIWPLQKFHVRQIRKAVDCIVGNNNSPDPTRYTEVLEFARDLLLQSSREEVYDNGVPKVFGHLIVVSPRLCLRAKELCFGDTIQRHFICPAVLPWKGQECEQINGWRLSSAYSRINSPVNASGKDQARLQDQLRKLVAQARRGANCGKLTNLYLKLHAGPHCFIDGVMGQTEIVALQAGEAKTILVKVRTDSLPLTKPTLSTFPHGFSSSTESIDLVKELNAMVGNASTCILKAELSYEHSLLPGPTRCSIKLEAHVQWGTPVVNPLSPAGTLNQANNENYRYVQRRLVYYLATHQLPRDAQTTLNKEFSKDGDRSFCLDYIKSITEELKYQARVMERFDLNHTEASEHASDHFRDMYDLIGEVAVKRSRSNTADSNDTFDLIKSAGHNRTNTQDSVDTFTLSEEPAPGKTGNPAEDVYDLTSSPSETYYTPCSTPKPRSILQPQNPPTPPTVIHRRRARATLFEIDTQEPRTQPRPRSQSRPQSQTKSRTESPPPVQDKARKIWGELRRESKSQRRLIIDGTQASDESAGGSSQSNTAVIDFGMGMGTSMAEVLGGNEKGRERIRELREMAIRNKRSIGTDTLRSFSLDVWGESGSGDQRMRGASAPWL